MNENNAKCPKCGTEIFLELWDSSECPNCGLECWWEEQGTDDYDTYSYIYWERY